MWWDIGGDLWPGNADGPDRLRFEGFNYAKELGCRCLLARQIGYSCTRRTFEGSLHKCSRDVGNIVITNTARVAD